MLTQPTKYTTGVFKRGHAPADGELPSIYLAGPDVFRQNAKEIFEEKKALCREFGFTGLSPLDTEVDKKPTKAATAHAIYQGNLALIEKCDVVIADINPFRGPSLDPGTAFEIGYAMALGKTILAYTDDPTVEYRHRVNIDRFFPVVEDFGLQENLMISCSVDVLTNSFVHALKIAQRLCRRSI